MLAAPVLAIHKLLSAIAPHLAPHAVVSDLGSTKAAVTHRARAALLNPSRFIGGHSVAGKERGKRGSR